MYQSIIDITKDDDELDTEILPLYSLRLRDQREKNRPNPSPFEVETLTSKYALHGYLSDKTKRYHGLTQRSVVAQHQDQTHLRKDKLRIQESLDRARLERTQVQEQKELSRMIQEEEASRRAEFAHRWEIPTEPSKSQDQQFYDHCAETYQAWMEPIRKLKQLEQERDEMRHDGRTIEWTCGHCHELNRRLMLTCEYCQNRKTTHNLEGTWELCQLGYRYGVFSPGWYHIQKQKGVLILRECPPRIWFVTPLHILSKTDQRIEFQMTVRHRTTVCGYIQFKEPRSSSDDFQLIWDDGVILRKQSTSSDILLIINVVVSLTQRMMMIDQPYELKRQSLLSRRASTATSRQQSPEATLIISIPHCHELESILRSCQEQSGHAQFISCLSLVQFLVSNPNSGWMRSQEMGQIQDALCQMFDKLPDDHEEETARVIVDALFWLHDTTQSWIPSDDMITIIIIVSLRLIIDIMLSCPGKGQIQVQGSKFCLAVASHSRQGLELAKHAGAQEALEDASREYVVRLSRSLRRRIRQVLESFNTIGECTTTQENMANHNTTHHNIYGPVMEDHFPLLKNDKDYWDA